MTSSALSTATSDVFARPSRLLRGGWTAAIVGGAGLLLAGTAVSPATPAGDHAGHLAVLGEQPTRAAIGGLLFLLGHLLLVGPVLRLSRLGGTAGGAAVAAGLGTVAFSGLGLVRVFEVALARTVEPADAARVLAEFESMPVALLAILPSVVAVNLGLLVLAVALWRRRLLPAWSPLLVVAGVGGVMSGGDGSAPGLIGSAMLGAFVILLTTVRGAPDDQR